MNMKKIKIGFFKKYNGLISLCLVLLGFSTACEQGADEYGTPSVEYGVPHATFIVKGNVKSENSSSMIPNIRVVMGYDTTFTNESGNYQVENTSFPDDQLFLVEFKDVDGSANGNYQPIDTVVEFKDPQFTGGSSWDAGKVENELNVNLKPKE